MVVFSKSRLPYKIMIAVITDATHDSKPVTAPFAPLGVSAMSSTFYITKKYQRLRTMTNNKLGIFSISILVITLIVVVMFSPLTALSTSQARLFVGSGFPNADIRGPRIMDLQQFFPPSCAQFPNCSGSSLCNQKSEHNNNFGKKLVINHHYRTKNLIAITSTNKICEGKHYKIW